MIPIPKTAEFQRNWNRNYGNLYCVICGRKVKNPTLFLECVGGGVDFCVPPETADTSLPDYMGLHPVGSDCVRNHPEIAPYVVVGIPE